MTNVPAKDIVPGFVVTGPGLAEPVEVFAASREDSGMRIAGLGVNTGAVCRGVWSAEQVARLGRHASGDVQLDSGRLTRTSLPIPVGQTYNFWYLNNDSDTALVFVHGIFSNGCTCWLHKDRDRAVYWPDLVRVDPRVETPSIYIGGYYTTVESGAFPLEQCARQLLEALERPDVFGRPRVLDKKHIAFVCHSTGGIVVRYLLCRYGRVLADKAVGLALIASPSRGSVWANVAGIAARYYNQKLGQQLRWGGEAIEEIHDRFKDLVNLPHSEIPDLFGMEACETRMVFRTRIPAFLRVLLPPRLKVVSTESAGQYFGQVKYLPETDHFSVVKPDSLSHPSHEFLETFLRRFREHVTGDAAEGQCAPAAAAPAVVSQSASDGHDLEYFAEQRHIIDHHVARFVPRADVESALDKFIRSNRRGYFIVSGSPGLGKTALACHLTATRRLVHHFVKRQDPRAEPRLVLASLLRQLADRIHLRVDVSADLPRLTRTFESALEQGAREAGSLIVVIDALDELDPKISSDLPFLPADTLPQGVFVILTSRPGEQLDRLQERLRDVPWRLYELDPLSSNEIQDVLARSGKTLGAADFARVEAACGGNALYLHALIDEIDGNSRFSFADLPAAIEGYFRQALRNLPDRDTAAEILALLAASRKPLTVAELAQMARLDAQHLQELVFTPLRAFLHHVDGGCTFYHQSFCDFVRTEVIDAAGLKAAHAAIAAWLLDPERGDDEYHWRSLAYHLFESGDARRFHDTIDDRFLRAKVKRFGFLVLEDVELLTRLLMKAGDPREVERAVSLVESLRRSAGGDLMADVARAVQFAQIVPRPESVGVSYTVTAPFGDIYVGMIPRIGVSADFVEVVAERASLWVAIGDVPSSGLRSAFVARFAANLFRRLVLVAPDANGREVLEQVGRSMQPFGNVARMSMQCARVDMSRGIARIASAGHPFPILFSARQGKCDRLPIRGRLLDGAASDGAFYDLRSVEISPGDVLILVSDGLTEASRLDDPYGYRFMADIESNGPKSARAIGERILAAWRSHPRNLEWRDDVTVVVIAFRGSGGATLAD